MSEIGIKDTCSIDAPSFGGQCTIKWRKTQK